MSTNIDPQNNSGETPEEPKPSTWHHVRPGAADAYEKKAKMATQKQQGSPLPRATNN